LIPPPSNSTVFLGLPVICPVPHKRAELDKFKGDVRRDVFDAERGGCLERAARVGGESGNMSNI